MVSILGAEVGSGGAEAAGASGRTAVSPCIKSAGDGGKKATINNNSQFDSPLRPKTQGAYR